MKKYFIVGGAGFIGSHLADTLLKQERNAKVVAYDNFSSGKMWHLEDMHCNSNLEIIKADIKDKETLVMAMKGADIVYHFACNPDISKAISQPDIDFWEGTYLTNNVLEAMRINNVKILLYASGSGVYGDTGLVEADEDYSPQLPISTYGASKLASEALICAYSHMLDIHGIVFRFANVVGPRQTHGVGYDFVRKLIQNPKELEILGDGTQSKSYIYVTDVIKAMRLLEKKSKKGYFYYNVATLDCITVNEIADTVVGIMGLKGVRYRYTGGVRGWKGDVPIVRMNTLKIRQLGWSNEYNSKQAICESVKAIVEELRLNMTRGLAAK
jgi:UDP-glucose 4-epimerase